MSRLLSFIGGMGSGYLSQMDKNQNRDRQERLDAQNQQLFDAKMDDINRVKADRQALADAGKAATVEEGAGGMLKPETMDNRDVGLPENADLPNQGLSDKAYRVGGQSYATQDEAGAAKTAYDAPDAVAGRTVQALRSTGRATEAMQMEAAVKSGKMSDIQLSAAKVQEARDAYNTIAMDNFRTLGVFNGVAKMMTDTNAMGQAGMKVEAIASEDGKTMQFYRTGADGRRTLAHQVPNTREGEMNLITASLKQPADKMVDWYQDSMKRATQADQWQKTHDRQSKQFGQTHALAVNADTRQGAAADLKINVDTLAYKKALQDSKTPALVVTQAKAYIDQIDNISKAEAKAMSEDRWAPESVGTKAQTELKAKLGKQLQDLLAPHMPKANAAASPGFGPLVKHGKPDSAAPSKMAPISFEAPVWDDAETAASKATGVPVRVLQSIRLKGERSNGDQVSPKGAQGVYQFIPSSRDAFLKKYGVDAYSADTNEQALAAAWHLKESFDRTGNWNQAMAGFNGGISGENGTNKTAQNRDYAERTRIGGIPTSAPNPF